MKTPRILLVDDDQSMRLALRRALDREGYCVFEAGNGLEALKQIDTHPVDLVITDIIMPDSEGIELTFALRKRYPEVPVIAMSGGGEWAPEPYLAIARTAGAAHIFSKPFAMNDFLSACAPCWEPILSSKKQLLLTDIAQVEPLFGLRTGTFIIDGTVDNQEFASFGL